MRIPDFAVLSVITVPQNAPTPHISKTHLPIVLLNVRELELNRRLKYQSRKKGVPHPSSAWWGKSNCRVNQWTGFYMITVSVLKELHELK